MTHEETIKSVEARLIKNPKSLLFARLADMVLKMGQVDRAIELCLEGIKHNPSYVTGNFILGKAYLAKGDQEKAEEEFKKVLSHDIQYLAAHKTLGDMMARMGWENKAVMHYKEILRVDPLDEEAYQMLETFSYKEDAGREFPRKKEEETSGFVSPERGELEFEKDEDWAAQLESVVSETRDEPVIERPTVTGTIAEPAAESDAFEEEAVTEETLQEGEAPDVPDTFPLTTLESEEAAPEPIDTIQEEPVPEAGDIEKPAAHALESEDSALADLETEGFAAEKEETDQPFPETDAFEPVTVGDVPAKEGEPIVPLSEAGDEPKTKEDEPLFISDETVTRPEGAEPDLETREETFEKPEDVGFQFDEDLESKTEEDEEKSTEEPADIEPEKDTAFLDALEEIEEEQAETEKSDIPAEEFKAEEVPSLLIEEETPVQEKETPEPPPETEEIEEIQIEEQDAPDETKTDEAVEDKPSPEEAAESAEKEKEGKLASPTLGEIYAAQGQYSKAIRVYETLIEKQPDDEERYRQKIDELKKKMKE